MISLAVALGLGAVAVLFWFDPLAVSFFPRCPLHFMTGLHCPGCGSLRALHRLFHADVAGALAMNPVTVLAIPWIGMLLLRPKWAMRPWVPWVCFGVLLFFGIARNLPVGVFAVLAPH